MSVSSSVISSQWPRWGLSLPTDVFRASRKSCSCWEPFWMTNRNNSSTWSAWVFWPLSNFSFSYSLSVNSFLERRYGLMLSAFSNLRNSIHLVCKQLSMFVQWAREDCWFTSGLAFINTVPLAPPAVTTAVTTAVTKRCPGRSAVKRNKCNYCTLMNKHVLRCSNLVNRIIWMFAQVVIS